MGTDFIDNLVTGDLIQASHINQYGPVINGLEDGAALLGGRSGGQTLKGDTASGGSLTLQSTAHATKGRIRLGGANVVELDESNGNLGIGTAPVSTTRLFASFAATTDSVWRPYLFDFNPAYNTGGAGVANSATSLSVRTTVTGSENLTNTHAGFNSRFDYDGAGTLTTCAANFGLLDHGGSGTVTSGRVYQGQTTVSGAGNITTSDVFLAASPSLTGSGVPVTQSGLRILNQGVSGITTSYGLRIAAQSGAANSWAIACDGATSNSYHQGKLMLGAASAPATLLELQETETLAASPADGYAGSLTLDPGYSAAYTVTRHNYIDCQNVSVASGAVVTDACLVRFDAAAGTHKALGVGTTKASPGTVSAWLKVNINGTIHYIPCYTSTTT
jgi:hypothetical protein